jgi:TusA-related sulfurtransferase
MADHAAFPRGASVAIPEANVLIEAGDEATSIVMAALTRGIDLLSDGQVLEVVSLSPSAHLDAFAWCRVSGHELAAMVAEGETVRCWIRKCEP